MRNKKTLLISSLVTVFLIYDFSFAKTIQERFKDKKKLTYKVSFNGIPSGRINWEYLGKEYLGDKETEVLTVSSTTKILKFLNLTSSEKVFIDSLTNLPLLVERDIVLFGKKEIIREVYDQKKGIVRIIRTDSKTRENILAQTTPIHNILALLYFFPEDIKLKKKKWMSFNLPNQKVKIRFISERTLSTSKGNKKTYFLIGRGAKRFNLWLDKLTRLPLRLEFVFPIGKIIIVKVD